MKEQQGKMSFEDLFLFGVLCLHVCMCTLCMSGANDGQKRFLDPLEMEPQRIMSRHMGTEIQFWIPPKSNKYS